MADESSDDAYRRPSGTLYEEDPNWSPNLTFPRIEEETWRDEDRERADQIDRDYEWLERDPGMER